jgi:pentapeptide MXKDX repeat protein
MARPSSAAAQGERMCPMTGPAPSPHLSNKETCMKKLMMVLVAAGVAMSTGAFAADGMKKDAMKKDGMAKDAMKKDGMAKDDMKKDAMKRDGMAKDAMKK